MNNVSSTFVVDTQDSNCRNGSNNINLLRKSRQNHIKKKKLKKIQINSVNNRGFEKAKEYQQDLLLTAKSSDNDKLNFEIAGIGSMSRNLFHTKSPTYANIAMKGLDTDKSLLNINTQ